MGSTPLVTARLTTVCFFFEQDNQLSVDGGAALQADADMVRIAVDCSLFREGRQGRERTAMVLVFLGVVGIFPLFACLWSYVVFPYTMTHPSLKILPPILPIRGPASPQPQAGG